MNLLTYKGYTVIVRKHGIVIQNGDGREIFHTIGKIKYKDYTENDLKQLIEKFLKIKEMTGKALEREFIKKYEEVQLDVEMKRKQCRKACFVNYHYSGRCEDCLFCKHQRLSRV